MKAYSEDQDRHREEFRKQAKDPLSKSQRKAYDALSYDWEMAPEGVSPLSLIALEKKRHVERRRAEGWSNVSVIFLKMASNSCAFEWRKKRSNPI